MSEANLGRPKCLSMMIELRIKAVGLARFLPVISEPVCLVAYLRCLTISFHVKAYLFEDNLVLTNVSTAGHTWASDNTGSSVGNDGTVEVRHNHDVELPRVLYDLLTN